MTNRRNRQISIIRNTTPCKSPTHGGGLLDLRCGELGRPGLEPGTNPESVRGCSHNQSKNRNKNTAGCGFLLTFESDLELPRFGNRSQFPCCNDFEPTSEPIRRLIAAAIISSDSALKV